MYARKEIILSAGAVHSPQVLQRSGVGPRKLLEQAGIEVVKELPGVGMNFQDHTSVNLGFNCKLIHFFLWIWLDETRTS